MGNQYDSPSRAKRSLTLSNKKRLEFHRYLISGTPRMANTYKNTTEFPTICTPHGKESEFAAFTEKRFTQKDFHHEIRTFIDSRFSHDLGAGNPFGRASLG
jgi:hypothetical protein